LVDPHATTQADVGARPARSRPGKRLLDIAVAAVGLFVLSPLMLLLALWVKLDSPGPAFFKQARLGQGGRPFMMAKLRTMREDAVPGPAITAHGDPRITRAGAWLRRTRLDELPQLVHVLVGSMSLVGPRPELPVLAAHLPNALRQRWLAHRPGMTDPTSLAHLDESAQLATAQRLNPQVDMTTLYMQQLLPQKIAVSVAYAERATLWSDLGVLWQTVARLIGVRS
jgi:lipopolysaccharide/colanic/teichoic acid biosynthesis glycosyltransferase